MKRVVKLSMIAYSAIHIIAVLHFLDVFEIIRELLS